MTHAFVKKETVQQQVTSNHFDDPAGSHADSPPFLLYIIMSVKK